MQFSIIHIFHEYLEDPLIYMDSKIFYTKVNLHFSFIFHECLKYLCVCVYKSMC